MPTITITPTTYPACEKSTRDELDQDGKTVTVTDKALPERTAYTWTLTSETEEGTASISGSADTAKQAEVDARTHHAAEQADETEPAADAAADTIVITLDDA